VGALRLLVPILPHGSRSETVTRTPDPLPIAGCRPLPDPSNIIVRTVDSTTAPVTATVTHKYRSFNYYWRQLARTQHPVTITTPLFIVGSGRSGTTLLRLILAGHSRIHISPETWFVLSLLEELPLKAVLSSTQV
jgi:Sulfotransferase family